jgi:hypothetical protein
MLMNKNKIIDDSHEVLLCLKNYICSNQLALAQYAFFANEQYKSLNNVYSSSLKGGDVKEQVANEMIGLDNILDKGLSDAFDRANDCVKSFFANRAQSMPRLCLKVFDEDKIFTLLRLPDQYPIETEGFGAEENTAFNRLSIGDKYYLCNDIPTAVVKNEYKNFRINRDKVVEYKNLLDNGANHDEIKDKWYDAWNPPATFSEKTNIMQRADPNTCYRSTLVLPLSLVKESLDKQFINHFNTSIDGKSIAFGFLCFDHADIDFFDEVNDQLFGYILADVLSLYLMLQLSCTEYSTVYNNSLRLLGY